MKLNDYYNQLYFSNRLMVNNNTKLQKNQLKRRQTNSYSTLKTSWKHILRGVH